MAFGDEILLKLQQLNPIDSVGITLKLMTARRFIENGLFASLNLKEAEASWSFSLLMLMAAAKSKDSSKKPLFDQFSQSVHFKGLIKTILCNNFLGNGSIPQTFCPC